MKSDAYDEMMFYFLRRLETKTALSGHRGRTLRCTALVDGGALWRKAIHLAVDICTYVRMSLH